MKKQNQKFLIIAAVAAVVILAVVIGIFALREPERPAGPVIRPTAPAVTTGPTLPDDTTVPTTVPETTGPMPTETEPDETEPEETEPTEEPTEDPAVEPTEPQIPEITAPSGVHFPYRIPDTGLVIEALNPYTGVFLEDGSDRDAEDVYALILRNTEEVCAEYIHITLTRDDGEELIFIASGMEAGARMVVMEANAREYEEAEYTDCRADVARVEGFEQSEDLILVEEDDRGALTVENISGRDIPCVRIFYKYYMADVDVYVGGITYTAKIVDLEAGATQTVMPSHYVGEDSRIVMVKVYDTAN